MASPITSLMIVYSTVYSAEIKENIMAPRHWPLYGELPVIGEFPAQMASNAEMFPFHDVIMLSAIFAFQVRLGVHEIYLFPVYAVSWFPVSRSLRTRVKWKPFVTPLGNTVLRSSHNWTNIQHLVCVEGAQLCRIVSILLFIWNYCRVLGSLFIVNSKMDAHDVVIKWKHFPRHWPFVREVYRSPVNSPHKGQWCGVLMFSFICSWK